MLEQASSYIESVITEHGALGVFLATVIEEAIAPIPSALVPLASGFFLLPPDKALAAILPQNILQVALPVALGVCLGSSVVYAIAYYGGKPLIERVGKFLGVTWEQIERINQTFSKGRSDEITLFVLRLIPIIPGVAISGFCGIIRYPFYRFLSITFAGAALRAFVLGLLGWQAGELYKEQLHTIDRAESMLLIVALVLVVLGAGYYFYRKRHAVGNGTAN